MSPTLQASDLDVEGQLRERLKLKYSGDCKCGHCQLVPAELVLTTADLLQSQSAQLAAEKARADKAEGELDEARDNAWPFGKRPNPVVGYTFGDFAVYGDEKSIKRVRAAMHEHDAMMPARIERIQELTANLAAANKQIEAMDLALEFYASEARAAKKHMATNNAAPLEAILTVLALDGGGRADNARTALSHEAHNGTGVDDERR